MKKMAYEPKQIEKVMNILNTIPVVGLESIDKFAEIIHTLNNFEMVDISPPKEGEEKDE